MTRQRAKQIALEAFFRNWYARCLYSPYFPYNGPVLSFTTDATVEVWRDINPVGREGDYELIGFDLVRTSVTDGANL